MRMISMSSILLTYKGKVLLMHRDMSAIVQTDWCLIEGKKEKNKSFEDSISRTVEREINIILTRVALISSSMSENMKKHFFHSELTDADVNNIRRDEGQTLQFFTIRELEKLSLTSDTKAFVSQHRDFLESVQN